MARGFGWSIYLMIAMPYTLLGLGGLLVWRSIKKAQRAQAEKSAQTLDTNPPA